MSTLSDRCVCYHSCNEDGDAPCPLHGDWHTHEGEPCPVHPEARMVGS